MPVMAFCIVLRRLAYPTRFGDMANMFGLSPPWLSFVFRDVIDHLVSRYRQKLQWSTQRLMRRPGSQG
ncbi:hypothetical protein V1509DRAFT_629527, partial [Lipomyces kononenkoae]